MSFLFSFERVYISKSIRNNNDGQISSLYDATDAKNAVIPHVVLASKDEDSKVTDEYNAIFMGEKSHLGSYATTYPTMHHGWMGARAKLDDEENKAEYERG